MDRITDLPDDLLLKILCFLPTKVAVSTCILSKRWEFLWMWLPKLDYSTDIMSDSEKLRCFLNRTLQLHRAPVIESFRLDLIRKLSEPKDVKQWVLVAVSRQLRELDIRYNPYFYEKVLLPSSLYACKSLEILKLSDGIIFYVPRNVCLPSLKILQLEKVTGVNGESLIRLLSICPVLEKLSVDFCGYYGNISVISPSLLSLSLRFENNLKKLEIDTPCLNYLKLEIGYINIFSMWNMPKLEEAYLNVGVYGISYLFGSITSVKRLTLCCSENVYSESFVFNQLEHLKLCACKADSANILARLLKNSPKLRVLDIFQMVHHWGQMLFEIVPSTVPECFLSTLQTFKWSGYLGRPTNLLVYILRNACCLKTATISFGQRLFQEKTQIINELSSSSRASTTCELIFD